MMMMMDNHFKTMMKDVLSWKQQVDGKQSLSIIIPYVNG